MKPKKVKRLYRTFAEISQILVTDERRTLTQKRFVALIEDLCGVLKLVNPIYGDIALSDWPEWDYGPWASEARLTRTFRG